MMERSTDEMESTIKDVWEMNKTHTKNHTIPKKMGGIIHPLFFSHDRGSTPNTEKKVKGRWTPHKLAYIINE